MVAAEFSSESDLVERAPTGRTIWQGSSRRGQKTAIKTRKKIKHLYIFQNDIYFSHNSLQILPDPWRRIRIRRGRKSPGAVTWTRRRWRQLAPGPASDEGIFRTNEAASATYWSRWEKMPDAADVCQRKTTVCQRHGSSRFLGGKKERLIIIATSRFPRLRRVLCKSKK